MRPKILKSLAIAATAIAFVAGMTTSATADVASFYKNKIITMYIGFSAGGGRLIPLTQVALDVVFARPACPV
ncbi:MAG: hypothetical protein O3C34_09020, partial [Proteobacteria bacterium]|nr:hypothetical protein [Pseudomonadota bacterium]